MDRVLVVDDEQGMREDLAAILQKEDREILQAENGRKALDQLQATQVDLVLSDIRMPDMDGLDLLGEIRRQWPEMPVIMLTAFASTETAIAALRAGAYDYLRKPFSLDEVRNCVEHALEQRRLFREVRYLRGCLRERYRFENIIGGSECMAEVYDLIRQVAESTCNVIITGESGTGKELAAQAIHYQSDRSDRPFVPVNCGGLPETLLESELFGHRKGAFTGAVSDREGLVAHANGGTLFLDEIGDMPATLQVRLLRVIQNREITRVGSSEPEKVDVRVIAATHDDLARAIKQGDFREDLYYRLNVVEISLPPLRERADDIPILASHFLKTYAEKSGKDVKGFSPEAMRCFRLYHWPGNVRELENVVERAVTLCQSEVIRVADLPDTLARPASGPTPVPEGGPLKKRLELFERSCIEEAIEQENHSLPEAAEALGISLSSLYRKMKRYGIEA